MDINECSRGIHGCDRNSNCENTAGSWNCICNNGWYPDPRNARLPTCRDVNECVNKPNACPSQSTCINSAGSYRCNCLSGWRNQGPHSCTDINECSEGSHSCPSNSRCANTQGSYRCNCVSGWRNQGYYSCVDIDECSEGRYSCPSYSSCVNTQGSYRCDCLRCYYKSGNTCHSKCAFKSYHFCCHLLYHQIYCCATLEITPPAWERSSVNHTAPLSFFVIMVIDSFAKKVTIHQLLTI